MNKKNILTLTIKAYDKIKMLLEKKNKHSILFYVKGGGCNGYNYQLEPTNNKPEKLDEVINYKDFNIQICNQSMMHILGTKIDWKEDIMGQSFHFDNPMAQSKCGCGTSFNSKALSVVSNNSIQTTISTNTNSIGICAFSGYQTVM